MQLNLDTDSQTLTIVDSGVTTRMPLFTREAFEAISRQWVRVGWSLKYPYTFSWMGRPVIQLPEDMLRMQEVIFRLKPDLIIETGVAHGGSLVFYASLCKAMDKGRVVGVDIEIRPHNRQAIESHALSELITLIEGSSTDPGIVAQVGALVQPGQTVLVILDSNHTYAHVLAELEAYAGMVTPGSYIVATDGIMKDLADVPRGQPGWTHDNPTRAAFEFAQSHPQFIIEQPHWPFNESDLQANITHWPGAWLRRAE
jgi:cephalosporin hydroxylase